MASVVTAAPTDGAPLLALHKMGKRFGATHALKVVIGKWLNHGAKLFIFDEPNLRRADAGVIMVSSYLTEVYKPADTLHVFRAGGLVASHTHKDANQAIGV